MFTAPAHIMTYSTRLPQNSWTSQTLANRFQQVAAIAKINKDYGLKNNMV
jgi:hypothetical protein